MYINSNFNSLDYIMARKVKIESEDSHQMRLAYWLDKVFPEDGAWKHVPNGVNAGKSGGIRLKYMGVKSGIPDIEIQVPPETKPDVRGVYIEMKTIRGITSKTQKDVHKGYHSFGWIGIVAKGAEVARDYVLELWPERAGRVKWPKHQQRRS
jgi:hypothetical protein